MAPIDLYWFTDGLFVVNGSGAGADQVGARVLRIGDLTPEEAIERVTPMVTRDNPMGIKWNGPYFLTYPAVANALGIDRSGDSTTLRLLVADRNGLKREVRLPGGPIRAPAKLMPPRGAPGGPPLYLSRPDEPYWLAALPAASALYVQYNQVVNGERVSVAAFAVGPLFGFVSSGPSPGSIRCGNLCRLAICFARQLESSCVDPSHRRHAFRL